MTHDADLAAVLAGTDELEAAALARLQDSAGLLQVGMADLRARALAAVDSIPAPCPPAGSKFPAGIVAPGRLANVRPGLLLDRVMAQRTDASSGSQSWGTRGYTPGYPGTGIDTATERTRWKDDACAAHVQALAWAATGDITYRLNVAKIADAYVPVTGMASDTAQDRKLYSGWAISNLARALSICGLTGHPLIVRLVDVWWKPTRPAPESLLDHGNNANWQAAFADAQVALAILTGRADLYARARDYLDLRASQAIYVRAIDGLAVRSLGTDSLTTSQWYGQVTSTLRPTGEVVVAEYRKDIGHAMMGLGHFTQAALTVQAQRDEPGRQLLARLAAGYELIAKVLLAHLQGAPLPAGVTLGGADRFDGWLPALTLLGPDRIPTVATLAARPEITARNGANGQVAQVLTDA